MTLIIAHHYLLGQKAHLGVLLLLFPLDDVLELFNLPVELLPLPLPLPRLLPQKSLVRPHLLLLTLQPQSEVLRPPGGLLYNEYFAFSVSRIR